MAEKAKGKELERAWRETTRKDGFSLFQAIRAARAAGRKPDPEVVMLHLSLIDIRADDGSLVWEREALHFVHALADASIDELDFRKHLAQQFLDGLPVDPYGETGWRHSCAIAFYLGLDDEFEGSDFLHSSFQVAMAHVRHRARANEILEQSRGRGNSKEMSDRVRRMIDDFLVVMLLFLKTTGVVPKFSNNPDEIKTDFAAILESYFEKIEAAFEVAAERQSMGQAEFDAIRKVLEDMRGRKLADRMRKIISVFGSIKVEA